MLWLPPTQSSVIDYGWANWLVIMGASGCKWSHAVNKRWQPFVNPIEKWRKLQGSGKSKKKKKMESGMSKTKNKKPTLQ